MSVKIKVSYETSQELARVLKVLKLITSTYKIAKSQEGRFKKAYISIKE